MKSVKDNIIYSRQRKRQHRLSLKYQLSENLQSRISFNKINTTKLNVNCKIATRYSLMKRFSKHLFETFFPFFISPHSPIETIRIYIRKYLLISRYRFTNQRYRRNFRNAYSKSISIIPKPVSKPHTSSP